MAKPGRQPIIHSGIGLLLTGGGAAVDALMRRLKHVRSSGPYTRDEMNER